MALAGRRLNDDHRFPFRRYDHLHAAAASVAVAFADVPAGKRVALFGA
jgi:hypothetical protein